MNKISFLNKSEIFKKPLVIFISFLIILSSCGIYKKTDARKIPINSKERQKMNIEQGKGFRLGNLGKTKSGTFNFATSNEMWRASMDVLEFASFTNVDYSGGIIITDWFTDDNVNSIKITVRFLSNEIRADGLKITLHQKDCTISESCKIEKINSNLSQEIKLAILKKATLLKQQEVPGNSQAGNIIKTDKR